jgi:hypothetical protein
MVIEDLEMREELATDELSAVRGGMIKLPRETPPPADPGHNGLDTPYWDTNAAHTRYGYGPWDYGYGSPTGPWNPIR